MAYEVSTTIEIAATPENVWAVLADLANYHEVAPDVPGGDGAAGRRKHAHHHDHPPDDRPYHDRQGQGADR